MINYTELSRVVADYMKSEYPELAGYEFTAWDGSLPMMDAMQMTFEVRSPQGKVWRQTSCVDNRRARNPDMLAASMQYAIKELFHRASMEKNAKPIESLTNLLNTLL